MAAQRAAPAGPGGATAGAGGTAGADASAGAAGSGGFAGCAPGSKQCSGDIPRTCDVAGKWQDGPSCPYGCAAGACKDAGCTAGQFNCYGNEVQRCDPGPPAQWVPKSPPLKCNPIAGQLCKKATGTCEQLVPLPAPSTPSTCHVYGKFNVTDGVFKGGYDIDSFGDYLYVNRSGQYLDVYQLTLEDTDGDGKLEPDQHPDNPLHTGPLEARKLTFVKTYSKAMDKVPLGPSTTSELYAKSDRIFILGKVMINGFDFGTISEYVFATQAVSVVLGPPSGTGPDAGSITPTGAPRSLGFGDSDGLWYGDGGFWSGATVLSWHAPTGEWVAEFQTFKSPIGGLEVVLAKTGQQYVYTSWYKDGGYIDQYRRDPTGWTHTNQLKYADFAVTTGMGFGALDHLWLSGGSQVVEVGGGDCAQYLK